MRAKDVMSAPVVTVRPETSLKEIARLLVEREISAVPVVDEEGGLLGIVSEADLVPLETAPDPRAHLIPFTHRSRALPRTAGDAMTRDVVVVQEQADAADVAELMMKHHVKRIPVVGDEKVVGVVSRRDLLKVIARPDPEILAELTESLDDELMMLRRFRAEVVEGRVTLRGPHDRPARRLAELLARSIPGVVEVRFEAETDDTYHRPG